MMTNGTGTGKTWSGLGVIKRFSRNGESNILIVAPSDGILDGWIKGAGEMGLAITRLGSTTEAGKGIVATTYANLAANRHLADRDFDLVVAHESHNLMSSKTGEMTSGLRALRAIADHPDGLRARAEMHLRDLIDKIEAEAKRRSARQPKSDREMPLIEELDQRTKELVEKFKGQKRGKALFLSATPFAYVETIDYGQGYLFDYGPEPESRGYNTPTARQAFFMRHFGYRMRTGKLTAPEAVMR